jgi:hypothetical protein
MASADVLQQQYQNWLPKFANQLDSSLNPTVAKLRKLLGPKQAEMVARFVWFYLHPEIEQKPLPERDRHPELDLRTLPERRTDAKRKQADNERAACDLERAGESAMVVSAPLAAQLRREAETLRSRAERLALVANLKRLGESGNHVWLVMLIEFVAGSTQQILNPADLGPLLECGLLALGREQDVSAEALEKALTRFRRNPKNQHLLEAIRKSVALQLDAMMQF